MLHYKLHGSSVLQLLSSCTFHLTLRALEVREFPIVTFQGHHSTDGMLLPPTPHRTDAGDCLRVDGCRLENKSYSRKPVTGSWLTKREKCCSFIAILCLFLTKDVLLNEGTTFFQSHSDEPQ